MKKALQLAQDAYASGEVPVGAIIISGNRVIAETHNRVERDADPTAHAEILAIREACRVIGTKCLAGCEIIVTLEPCPMCAQAISLARLDTLTFGAYDPKGGGVEHGPRIFQQPSCHHAPEIIGGVMESECAALLKNFFQSRR